MTYIDGFVIAVPTAKKEAFIAFSEKFDKLFHEFGALRVVENWGVEIPDGTRTDFKKAVQAGEDETVVFSWVEWPDKATRDSGMAKFEADPRLSESPDEVPFDGARMIFGSFETIIDL